MKYIDLNNDAHRQIIVDREEGQYLGHVSSILLEDGKTIIAVYPKGHGRGSIIEKMSYDGGLTWTERLPLPESFVTSMEVPTIFRTTDKDGKKRIVLFSGLYPVRYALSEDDGYHWSELVPAGNYGGIVAMGDMIPLNEPGKYMALFHSEPYMLYGGNKGERVTFTKYTDGDRVKYVRRSDRLQENGEYAFEYSIHAEGDRSVPEENGEVIYECFVGERDGYNIFSVDKVISRDGGLTWSEPVAIARHATAHLCEPGAIRLTDGRIAVLLRENSRKHQSFIIISDDDGETWSRPREVSDDLTGDRHTIRRLPDGRIAVTFRDVGFQSKTHGDWVLWVGTEEDLVNGQGGQYKFRLKDNMKTLTDGDCAYPGMHVLEDGTIVAITYGHWVEWENGKNQPYILCVRLNLKEFDEN